MKFGNANTSLTWGVYLFVFIDFEDISLPFSTIYEARKIDENSEFFLPGIPVRVKIIERIRQAASHRLNPTL